MRTHHFIVIDEHRIDDRIDEVVRQLAVGNGKVEETDRLIVPKQGRVAARRNHRASQFRQREAQSDDLRRCQRYVTDFRRGFELREGWERNASADGQGIQGTFLDLDSQLLPSADLEPSVDSEKLEEFRDICAAGTARRSDADTLT